MHHVSKYQLNANGVYTPFVEIGGELREVVWAPLPGSQEAFLKCAETEVLAEGTRGSAKTTALIMDYCQHVGQSFGAEWKGIFFRRTHPQLAEVISLSKTWIKKIFPEAQFNEMKSVWTFPDGATLRFAHFPEPSSYDDYLGHAYSFIGWEELCSWPNDECFKAMYACSRSTVQGMPRKVRATTNPYGVGRSWVMQRFRLPLPPGTILGPVITDGVDEKGNKEPPRRAVHSHLSENLLLQAADPDYAQRISASARNPSERAAWLLGDWNITAGGMLTDVWAQCRPVAVVPPFEVPPGWRIFRAMDYGSSKPYAVLWFTKSNGEDLLCADGGVRSTMRGDLFLVGELYGFTGKPNEGLRLPVSEIARRIKVYEAKRGWANRVRNGPADTNIFDDSDRPSLASDFQRAGICWEKAEKGPGSRQQGWEQLRKRLLATIRVDGIREGPGLFIVGEHCQQWLRTVPSLPRDEKNMDDVDTDAEDHLADCSRYLLRFDTAPFFRSRRI